MTISSEEWIIHSYTMKPLNNLFTPHLKSYPFKMCNETNFNLFLFFKQKIVISKQNGLTVLSLPNWAYESWCLKGEQVCGWDILNISSGIYIMDIYYILKYLAMYFQRNIRCIF